MLTVAGVDPCTESNRVSLSSNSEVELDQIRMEVFETKFMTYWLPSGCA